MVTKKPPAGSKPSAAVKSKRGISPKAGKSPKQTSIKFSAKIEKMESNSRGTKLGLLIPDKDMKAVSALMLSRLPNTYLEIVAIVKVKDADSKKKKQKRGVRRSRFGKYKE